MSSCRKTLFKVLGHKDYPRHKILEKMLAKGFEKEEVEKNLDQLAEKGWYQEDRYTEFRIKGLAEKVYGPLYIQKDLESQDIFVEIQQIASVLDEFGLNMEQKLRSLAQKKLKEGKHHLKVKEFLLRRGFSWDELSFLDS